MGRHLMRKAKYFLVILLAVILVTGPVSGIANAAEISGGVINLAVNSTTQTVMFAEQEWYVIGFNGSGVYSQINTVTLLAKICILLFRFGTLPALSMKENILTRRTIMTAHYNGAW